MTKPGFVVSLESIQDRHNGLVGAKATGLRRLSLIGLAVPGGFCVTGPAYRRHIDSHNLLPLLDSALVRLEHAEAGEKDDVLSGLRRAIIDAPLDDGLRREIERCYGTLACERLAVRSSATAEDLPRHSFAGLYDTFLNVTNLAGCLEAVKRCWASLWTGRAYDYRSRNGFDHRAVEMAVIVQELVPADCSGVIFTADPLTGRTDRIAVEAVFGLGDLLVSGRAAPDRFTLDKKRLTIISSSIADKKIMSVPDDPGVREQAVGSERTSAQCVDDATVIELARLARRAESQLGCPQDMEWAIRGKKMFFLQSRPITTIAKEKSRDDRQVWSNIMAQEVMPDVVTPATLSIIENLAEAMFDPLFDALCMKRGDHPLYGVLAGRIYFNLNLGIAVIRTLPGLDRYDFTKDIGSEPGLRQLVEIEKTLTDEDLPELNFKRLRFFLKIPLLLLGSLASTPGKGRSIIAHVKDRNERWQNLDLAELSTEQLVESCKGVVADFRELLGKSLYIFSVMAAFPALEIVCSRWLSDEQQCAKRLLGGLGDMEDANSGLDLWRLALTADANPQVKDTVLSNGDWQTVGAALARTGPGREFLAGWKKFMDRHGFHSRAEIELFNRRWSETPDYILGILRSYIGSIGRTDPLENQSRLAAQREQLADKCRKQLRNPMNRMIFNHLLIRSQRGSVFRENIKCEAVKLLTAMRNTLLELGRRLNAESVLEQPDDIFFLKIEELEPVIQARPGFDVPATIAARRAEYDHWKSVTPPGTIVGRFDPETSAARPVDTDAETLTGLAVSAGVVTGKARVILRADSREQVLPGEILVAPFTDPGWTPYFVPAAGLVMDQGSLMSHGSIIAREYGLPAIVNVGSATRIIKTGQAIQVDGNAGIVRILKQPGDTR